MIKDRDSGGNKTNLQKETKLLHFKSTTKGAPIEFLHFLPPTSYHTDTVMNTKHSHDYKCSRTIIVTDLNNLSSCLEWSQSPF